MYRSFNVMLPFCLETSLTPKGLRLFVAADWSPVFVFRNFPDSKGIKTSTYIPSSLVCDRFRNFPDSKGIKTKQRLKYALNEV